MRPEDCAVSVQESTEAAGVSLPPVPSAVASYKPVQRCGEMVFVSGQVPMQDGKPIVTGRVPTDVSVDEAAELCARCAVQGIAALQSVLGPDEGLVRVGRVGVFVACDASFTAQPRVGDGASNLLERVFGEHGRHARAAVGAAALPLGVPVEVEFTFQVGLLAGE